jgi:zinc transport system substrate-binding protein
MMKNKILLSLLFSVTVASCGNSPLENKLLVATLFPHYSLANQLAGDLIDVEFLLPIGSDPHDFEPNASQRVKLNQADIVLYTSHEFETWIDAIEETAQGNLIDLSEYVNLVEGVPHDDEGFGFKYDAGDLDKEYDPHYWIDPENALLMLTVIYDTLLPLLPDDELLLTSRKTLIEDAFVEIIEAFDSLVEGEEELDVVFAGHNAFAYLEHYGIHVLTPYPGFSSDVLPTPQSIIDFTNLMTSLSSDILYVSSTDNVSVIEVLLEANPSLVTYVLYTIENVSLDQFNAGISYQELLMLNYEALSESAN